MKTIFIKREIKSEKDLPIIAGNYIIKEFYRTYVTQFIFDPLSKYDRDMFLNKIDFWLEKVETPEWEEVEKKFKEWYTPFKIYTDIIEWLEQKLKIYQ